MKTKRVYLLLIALMLISLISCGADDSADGGDIDAPLSPEDALILVSDGVANYTVVRSDFAANGGDEVKASVAIRKHIAELTGIEPTLMTDYEGKGGTPRTELEILVGNTNREESKSALASLEASENDYLITVINSKICLVGKSERAVRFAADELINNHLKSTDNTIKLSKELMVLGNTFIPEGTYFEVSAASGTGHVKYDDALALACLQGIMNRESPARVYVNSGGGNELWLKTMQEEGRWLEDIKFEKLSGFEELLKAGGADFVKAAIIWDEAVPATVNVATTIAGVEDGIVFSADAYEKYKGLLDEKIKLIDLRGKFDGSITGSAKNDAYRWAIDNYLKKDLCSLDFLAHYMDAWSSEAPNGRRIAGDDAYVVVRDWAVYNRSFVIDLSPWDDEAPFDDQSQPVGTDHETFTMVLEYMYEKTKDKTPFEMCGFFDFTKYSVNGPNTISKHPTVPAEWEYVWLISHYNGYHNTCIEWSWNESFHSQYTGAPQLENNRPKEYLTLERDTVYLCFFMADYDSTYPLYRFMQDYWQDPNRGKLPLAWGINPNLLDTYPDIIEYYYDTATENDYFTSDASCAGYINPSRIRDEMWEKMTEHNVKYFKRADMSIAPMVLDQNRLDEQALEAFSKFAPDGLSTIIMDLHGNGGSQAPASVYNGIMPTDILYNNFPAGTGQVDAAVNAVKSCVNASLVRKLGKTASRSALALIRCVWTTPSNILEVVETYKEKNPGKNVVVVDIYNYFNLLKQDLES